MYTTCLEKQRTIAKQFAQCSSKEEKYHLIIALGRQLPGFNPKDRTPANIVKGCQSTMYLHSYMEKGNVIFEVDSDAIISAGLAAILLQAYSGETPETILKCPPDYLEELGISASLTPSRANGLYSIHLRMKQDALKFLMLQNK